MARLGGSVDKALSHRRLFHVTSDVRPLPDSAVFERIGGQGTIDRLVDSLYDRFEADRAIRPFFGRDLASSRTRQKRFFCEWLGGPPRYSESAWGGLYRHHEDLRITAAVAERWLGHLAGALDDTVPASDDAAFILQRAREVTRVLVNSDPDPDAATGTPKHRSQQVAACGVGARTLKQAGLLAQRGKVDELAKLVAQIPDVVGRVPFGAQLLQGATFAGRIAVVEWLLDHGVDANTPWPLPVRLVGGAWEGRKDNPVYVAALLRCGAGMDQRYNGATPLHYVVKAGFVQTIQVLLEHGADSQALDNRGRTPLDWLDQAAKSVDRDAVRSVLKRHSGDQ